MNVRIFSVAVNTESKESKKRREVKTIEIGWKEGGNDAMRCDASIVERVYCRKHSRQSSGMLCGRKG